MYANFTDSRTAWVKTHLLAQTREVLAFYLANAKLNPFLKRGIKNRSTEFIHDCYRMGAGQHCVSVHTGSGACDGPMLGHGALKARAMLYYLRPITL